MSIPKSTVRTEVIWRRSPRQECPLCTVRRRRCATAMPYIPSAATAALESTSALAPIRFRRISSVGCPGRSLRRGGYPRWVKSIGPRRLGRHRSGSVAPPGSCPLREDASRLPRTGSAPSPRQRIIPAHLSFFHRRQLGAVKAVGARVPRESEYPSRHARAQQKPRSWAMCSA